MSETRTLLLELHCEEIPARFLEPLCNDMAMMLSSDLEGLGVIEGTSASIEQAFEVFFSPRKLAVRLRGLAVNIPDKETPQVGPPQRMCVDDAGKPTQTGLKFAEKCGVAFEEIQFKFLPGKKEPCAFVTMVEKGRPTISLLSELCEALVPHLDVPKAMRWGSSDFKFVRPIRNILCLFGEEVVDFAVDGVRSGNTTWGHRLYHRQHAEPIVVKRPEDYEAALAKAGIVVSFAERKAELAKQLDAMAAEVKGRVVADDHLLDTLAEIVEVPKVVRGDFPADFLELPKEVLVTSLKEHQKAFCIEDAGGKLLPHFLTAANRADDPKGFVKSGNEWVLKARLYDARFFFAEDRKHPIEPRASSLTTLMFQKELGSYYDKSVRIADLIKRLASRVVGVDEEDAFTAGRLSKFDLRTLMVGEFPELQGAMGGEYLKLAGAPDSVWKAVKEHYQPKGADDALPSTDLGALLSIADKLDTVASCFSVGLIPSGSKDPLALRRAGQGIVRILWEREWPEITLGFVVSLGFGRVTQGDGQALRTNLENFFHDRVAYQLEQAGYAGAVRRSALATGWSDLRDLKARCEALSAFAEDPRFASLAQSAKRIANILKDESPSDAFDAAALQDPSEKTLAALLAKLEATRDHKALLAELAELAAPLAAFFEAVMVKADDPALRAARLSLLHRLRQAFLRVADFSQWQ